MPNPDGKDPLNSATNPSLTLSLTRYFQAPPERVFAAWTQPELLKQWFAPRPVETVQAEIDLRVGGVQRITMRMPDGTVHPQLGVYLEVEPDFRLVAITSFGPGWQPAPPPTPGLVPPSSWLPTATAPAVRPSGPRRSPLSPTASG